MDNALEQIRLMAICAELTIIIELSPDSLKSTVIDFSAAKLKNGVHPLHTILSSKEQERLAPYLQQVHQVYYVFYPSKRIFGLYNIPTLTSLVMFIYKSGAKIIHFDTFSGRCILILPLLMPYKLAASIHDPAPHQGEASIKKLIISYVYRKVTSRYLFYSTFALNQFEEKYRTSRFSLFQIRLLPYTYITRFELQESNIKKYILYFGRQSYYKGIDLFMASLDRVLVAYPELEVVVAGKSHGGIDFARVPLQFKDRIHIKDYHVSIEELATLVRNALFVVCPYREATQSGVLMTSLAMDKPVLATTVGAFPEYIKSEENGILVHPDKDAIAKGIQTMLNNDRYLNLAKNIIHENKTQVELTNLEVYKKFYDYGYALK